MPKNESLDDALTAVVKAHACTLGELRETLDRAFWAHVLARATSIADAARIAGTSRATASLAAAKYGERRAGR